jgi:hypothetical protein
MLPAQLLNFRQGPRGARRALGWVRTGLDRLDQYFESQTCGRWRDHRRSQQTLTDPLLAGLANAITAGERHLQRVLAFPRARLFTKRFPRAHGHGIVLAPHHSNVELSRRAQRQLRLDGMVSAALRPVAFECLQFQARRFAG